MVSRRAPAARTHGSSPSACRRPELTDPGSVGSDLADEVCRLLPILQRIIDGRGRDRKRRDTHELVAIFCRAGVTTGKPLHVTRLTRVLRDYPQTHARSEEHTSELQSPCNLVCRLLLEKKK